MALETIPDGGTELGGRALNRMLRELQGLKFTVVAGAGANTDIAVAGLGADDTLKAVIEVVDPGSAATTPVLVDRTSTTVIQSAGNIRSTAATNSTGAGARLLVVWHDKTGL